MIHLTSFVCGIVVIRKSGNVCMYNTFRPLGKEERRFSQPGLDW